MSKIDLRSVLPPVRNQRSLHSCAALALCDILWCEFNRPDQNAAGLKPFEPSVLFLYYNARKRAGHENHNVPVRTSEAIEAAREFGICSEEAWPYQPGRYRERPSTAAYEEARPCAHLHFEKLHQDLGAIRACLEEGIPFLFCLRLFSSNCHSFEHGETANSGRLQLPHEGEEPVRNHALLGIGYDDATGEVLARNSFGPKWGDSGHVLIPKAYVLDSQKAYAFWHIASRGT